MQFDCAIRQHAPLGRELHNDATAILSVGQPRDESELLVHRDAFGHAGNQQVRIAVNLGITENRPHQAGDDVPVAMLRLHRKQAHLERARPQRGELGRIRHLVGDGKRSLVVAADHAHHAVFVDRDVVGVAVVELIDEAILARIGMLRKLADEGLVVEAMDLGELVGRLTGLERVSPQLDAGRRINPIAAGNGFHRAGPTGF